jgi:hypothetical protein
MARDRYVQLAKNLGKNPDFTKKIQQNETNNDLNIKPNKII